MSLQCRRMPSFLAIADFLRPQSLEFGSTFIYGVRISFESFSGVDIPNIRQKGTRLGNWLTREQAKELLAVPDRSTLKGKRDS